MSQQNEIIEYLNKNGGQITAKAANSMGILPECCETCILMIGLKD
jgi:hypothetical protein